jgi:porin
VNRRTRALATVLGVVLVVAPVWAQEAAPQDAEEATAAEERPVTEDTQGDSGGPGHKSGYEEKPVFGGPSSAQAQLEEDDRVKQPAFRLARFDRVLKPWFDWKRRLHDEHGLQLSGHYVAAWQTVNESLTDEDDAGSGVFRLTGAWEVLDRGTEDTGSIVVDHRHAYTDVSPANLGGEAGYLGQSGTLLSDVNLVLVELNWKQSFNDRRAGLIVGRFDPTDYMNVLGYANPWTTFQNLALVVDASTAFPDASFDIGGGSWIRDRWYVLGTVNDANGTLTEEFDFFEGGAEFFSQAEVGWSPSKDER